MVDFIDLIELFKLHEGKLDKIRLYGRVTGTMPAPKSLSSSVVPDEDCVCVNVDLIAVNLASYKDELVRKGISNVDNIYFVHGSIATYVDKSVILDDWYSLDGTLRLAKKQVSTIPVVAMFEFHLTKDSQWGIHKTRISDVNINEFDAKSGRVYDFILKSEEAGRIVLPPEAEHLTSFYSDAPDTLNIPQMENSNEYKQENWRQTTLYEVDMTRNELVSKNFVPENRQDFIPLSQNVRELSMVCDKAKESRNNFIATLKQEFPLEKGEKYIDFMLTAIESNLNKKSNPYSSNGTQLLKSYLLSCGADLEADYLGMHIGRYLTGVFEDIHTAMFSDSVQFSGLADSYFKNYFFNTELFYAGMISEITGVSSTSLISLAKYLYKNKISFSAILNSNPYLFCLISDHLDFDSIEYLSLCMGLAESEEPSILDRTVKDYKDICLVSNYILSSESCGTCCGERELKGKKLGIIISQFKYSRIQTGGTYLTDNVRANLCVYVSDNLNNNSWIYTKADWKSCKSYLYMSEMPSSCISRAIEEGIKLGTLVRLQINNYLWISHISLAEKELFLSVKVHEFEGSQTSPDFSASVDRLVSEWQSTGGMTLTEEQLNIVNLLHNNIFAITGQRGSGKSVVLDCICYILKGIYGEDYNIQYYSPVPSRRVSDEVIHMRSISSPYVSGEDGLFDGIPTCYDDDIDCYILLEQDMATLDDMYLALSGISSDKRVILVGDLNNRPPVGKGIPFKNMLRVLPAGVLSSVIKRDSAITANLDVLAHNSELSTWKELQSGDDCCFLTCEDNDIPVITQLLCKYHTGMISEQESNLLSNKLNGQKLLELPKLASRDIQINTPIEKSTYLWGNYNINNAVRGIFNATEGYQMFTWGSEFKRITFKIGDRVIHTKNSPELPWYSSSSKGVLQKKWGYGVRAGSVGCIVGIYPSTACQFVEMSGEKPNRYTPSKRGIRNDIQFVGADKFFVLVRYFDNLEGTSYLVAYRAYLDSNNDTKSCRSFKGGDFDSLQLFYSGTTNRLLGSKSKMVIALLGTLSYDRFVNRNMLYSQMSSAEEALYVIGSVSNERGSQLSKARLYSSNELYNTIGELLCR